MLLGPSQPFRRFLRPPALPELVNPRRCQNVNTSPQYQYIIRTYQSKRLHATESNCICMPRSLPQSRVTRIIPSYRGTHPADLAARRLAEVNPNQNGQLAILELFTHLIHLAGSIPCAAAR